MAKETVVAGIDIGSSKISALIGEVGREARLRVIGVGIAPSRGIRRGAVVNIEQAVESIGAAVEKAERVSGFKIMGGLVTVSGGHVSSQNNRGVVAVAHPDRVIRAEDVERAVEASRLINLPGDRQILHALPRAFEVDGQEGVRNPVAMLGTRLDVDTHVVTGGVTAIQNLVQCLKRAGVEVEGLVLESLASAEAVLSEEEREMGVALVDIGGGTTNLALFADGTVFHTSVLGIGGGHVTNDIAVGLRSPLGVAEDLKLRHTYALAAEVDERDIVQIATFGGAKEEVSRRRLCEIAEARLEEILALVEAEIGRAGFAGLLPAGIVLTGGTAETPGIAELAREVCQVPVRVGKPRGVAGLGDLVSGPAYSAAVGLLLWGARTGGSSLAAGGSRPASMRRPGGGSGSPLQTAWARVGAWLRSFLP